MERFLQATVDGLAQSAVLALIAVGYVIIYKSTRVFSFAQPAFVLLGGWLLSFLATAGLGALGGAADEKFLWLISVPISFWIAIFVAILITAVVGLGVERAAIRPMIGKPVFAVAILTIGVDTVIRTLVNRWIGVNVRTTGFPYQANSIDLGPVTVRWSSIATILTTVVVVAAVLAFFQYSRTGLAMRATAFDQEVALAQGISVGGVFALSWALAAGMAALAGAWIGTGFAGFTQSSFTVGLKAIPAVVVGGLDSISGALVGSVIIGLAETYTATYQAQYFPWLGSNFSQVVPYVVMFVVLLVRPYGLFGTKEVERV